MPQRKTVRRSNRRKPHRIRGRRPAAGVLRERQVLPGSVQAVLDLQRTIGNRATVAFLQRQNDEGSATVVGSASSEEYAYEGGPGSYTQELVGDDDIYVDPTEALGETATEAHRFESQHPSIAQLGIRPKEIKGKKLGVYVGNNNYVNFLSLSGAKADAEKMKGTMEGHDYETLDHQEDKNAQEMDAIYSGGINKAKSGDALLLYYAGHGVQEGMVGVEADEAGSENEQGREQEAGGDARALKFVSAAELEANASSDVSVTDVERYTQITQMLEAGVADGVHITLIADTCFSGAVADLIRTKAVEKLAKTENTKVKAATEQVKRLEDMKEQIPEGGGQSDEASRGIVLETAATLVPDNKKAAKKYWEGVVRPELKILSAYLKAAGMPITVPNVPSDYSKAGIEQVINQVINALIDLAEQLKEETEESTLEKAPG
jgi:hypothetical protein